uniref:Reverse transcriptase Ty1/copia-type domain-containing protein n=1 Tax=Amphimedon queenslandica TaxID=400682 RepID=A0A1X7U6N9_AMPQE
MSSQMMENTYDNRHSTFGIVFTQSIGVVSWYSKKQPVVALSTAEAEYISLSAATQETIWHKRLLKNLSCSTTKDPTIITEDNRGAIAIAKNPVYHSQTKHVDIKYHYIREAIQDKAIQLEYFPTKEMLADILTKQLAREKFEKLRKKM